VNDDGVIVRRVLAGDTEAYRILVGRHRDRFARFAYRMLGNREDAEEALQDAFIRAWRALDQCADPDRFDNWCFRILANRCRTRGSRRGRYEATFVADEAAVENSADPAAGGREFEEGEEIARALGQLEPASREAFLLKYVEEMTYDEMAELTGEGVSALKMRVKRACERLRHLLETYHV
jgi:RNA polymerase sigma-70 factor (ECF subfamily)